MYIKHCGVKKIDFYFRHFKFTFDARMTNSVLVSFQIREMLSIKCRQTLLKFVRSGNINLSSNHPIKTFVELGTYLVPIAQHFFWR